MFGADDESDGSDDDAPEDQGAPVMRSLSMREEVQPTESNEGSSIMRANGGRPQRKTKSKNSSADFDTTSFHRKDLSLVVRFVRAFLVIPLFLKAKTLWTHR